MPNRTPDRIAGLELGLWDPCLEDLSEYLHERSEHGDLRGLSDCGCLALAECMLEWHQEIREIQEADYAKGR